ncbi:MAG: biotin--[Clostridia bacterium]|nr:biotin--[acetyl-CoA-carboxylase] ligase [Clostridia bacterium]
MKKRNEKAEFVLRTLLSECRAVPKELDIISFEETDSTNKDAKAVAKDTARDALFIAERQTAGRGRLGRSFSSDGGGLYMTLLLKRKMEPDDALKLTVTAAVCVARAVKKLCAIEVGIKWVNDIFLDGKKLAGILCEGACDEFGKITHAVLGIGLNIFPPSDEALSDIATALSEHMEAVPSKELLAAFITEEIYLALGESFSDVLSEYKKHSVLIGRDVRVIKLSCEYSARVLDIDDKGALVLLLESGEIEHLGTGEVSVRL